MKVSERELGVRKKGGMSSEMSGLLSGFTLGRGMWKGRGGHAAGQWQAGNSEGLPLRPSPVALRTLCSTLDAIANPGAVWRAGYCNYLQLLAPGHTQYSACSKEIPKYLVAPRATSTVLHTTSRTYNNTISRGAQQRDRTQHTHNARQRASFQPPLPMHRVWIIPGLRATNLGQGLVDTIQSTPPCPCMARQLICLPRLPARMGLVSGLRIPPIWALCALGKIALSHAQASNVC